MSRSAHGHPLRHTEPGILTTSELRLPLERWQNDSGAIAVPAQVLFPQVVFAAKRFLAEKLNRKGGSQHPELVDSATGQLASWSRRCSHPSESHQAPKAPTFGNSEV
jgi:hypothetical protein